MQTSSAGGRKTIEQVPERLREFALKILLRKEKGIMAVIYATLIVKGKKTLD